MVCRFVCRLIVIGLMWAVVAFGLSMAPEQVTRRVEVVQERIASRAPPRLARAHDKVVERIGGLKDRLFD